MEREAARQRLLQLLGEGSDLGSAAQLLSWDQEVCLPSEAVAARAEELATLERLRHERLVSPELEELAASLRDDPEVGALARATLREVARAKSLPATLVAELARAKAMALGAWHRARQERSFAAFAAALGSLLERTREAAGHVPLEGTVYDRLLYLRGEDGVTQARLAELFSTLAERLPALLARALERQGDGDDEVFRRPYPPERQEAFLRHVASLLGYDFRRGRLDRSVHPFTTGVHPDDVRITVRVHPGNLGFGLFALIHEVGHALYEQGLPRAFARTPLGTAISTSVHESQSRFFENVVGRHPAFWRHLTPLVQSYFPGVADDVSAPAFARAAQTVRPGPIRVEADELSYSLHIVLRFRLEVALLSGELSVAEVPAAWRELSQELLGVLPEDDVLGPLQDIHWALGEFASFPSYALGNLVAAILYEALLAEMGEEAFSAALAAGDLAPVRAFLSRRLWQHGARFGLDEWLREEIGNELSALPYLRYLAGRYAD